MVRDGLQQGFAKNFLSLVIDPTIDADFYAFSDQDDIWKPDKLECALEWLMTASSDVPALYCSRAELVTSDGDTAGMSPSCLGN